MSKKKTPQEKKAESYEKDRRYSYGNNAKAARKAVPRNKANVNRANRHAASQSLADVEGRVDGDRADAAEARLDAKRPKTWKKVPDRPLGEVVPRQLKRRAARDEASKESVEKKVDRVQRRVRKS